MDQTSVGKPMTPAVAYMRCSGDAFLGETWARQEEAINRYAAANGIEILEWFRDEYVSGKTELKDRAGLGACMARVEANCVKIVLVESADRLARDFMVSELIIREFQKFGVKVITAAGGVDLTTGDDSNPTAKLVRQILAAVAEFDRCMIVLKLRGARERLRQQNGKCEGQKAYGIDDNERAVLNLMLTYQSGGLENQQIANKLNAAGIKTRYGKRWHGATVWKILDRHDRETTKTLSAP